MAISHMTDRVGQVLGGRYRLVTPIGTGASASVYLADDVTLRRRVAVKILHDALADDAAFLERFRAEAQAAAALNHPHVMAVYDWGHGDVPYLVTEYLGGGSLRSMLDLGRLLTLSQALMVGLEAARGLEYAHRNGFVHRDIKPANLLFDEDGRLRIADFGLARALAEAAWTEPMGAVLGTARYASPEQAQGVALDGKSDVYSLALVMIEAVTGSVPFATDTTLGTLMARVNQPVTIGPEFGPLRQLLERACAVDPTERPDAGELAAMLMDAAKDLDRPDKLELVGATDREVSRLEDRNPTSVYVAERKAVEGIEPDIMFAPPGTTTDGLTILHEGDGQPDTRWVDRDGEQRSGDGAKRGKNGRSRRSRKSTETADSIAAPRDVDKRIVDKQITASSTDSIDGADRRKRRWPKVLVSLVVILGLAAGSFAYWYNEIRVPTFVVPELVGRDIGDIGELTSGTRWVIDQTGIRQDGTVPGQILAQEPGTGISLARGGTLAVTFSLGPTLVGVPGDVVGMELSEATVRLGEVGLVVGDVVREYSEDVPADTVLSLGPDTPGQLPKGDAVALVVSGGPEPRTIPAGLEGQSAADARAVLEDLGLGVTIDKRSSEAVDEGIVIGVEPSSGVQVERDSTVTLVVSSGPPMVVIPDVAGLSAADAATRLQAAGLVVSSTQGSPANKATGTNPGAGKSVRRGSSVAIITG